MNFRALLLLAALVLGGCADPPTVAGNVTEVVDAVVDTSNDVAREADNIATQASIALNDTVPTVLALQEAAEVVAEVLPPAEVRHHGLDDASVRLIERWEVGSPARYNKSLSGIYCPPGASGPTGGIGYDFGHQTPSEIRRVWADHPRVDDLAGASGQTGQVKCKAWVARHKTIRIFYADATRIFQTDSLPKYERMASRALRNGWDGMASRPKGAAVSLGYNRGWSMAGSKNIEKRVMRDDCYPRGDFHCQAEQLIAMCRIWAGTPYYTGLCNRRKDEARLSRQG